MTYKLILAALALTVGASAGANMATSNSSSSNVDVTDPNYGTTSGSTTATGNGSQGANAAGNATITNTSPTSGAMRMAPKSDAEIVAILEAANQAEIQAAQIAQTNGSNSGVKSFAQNMMSAHKMNDSKGDALASRLKITPAASESSRDLAKTSQAKIDDMKNKKGAEFDRAYIDSQVMMHGQLAGNLEQTLIPAAKNSEFKSFLQETLTHVRGHLSDAQKLQASLGGGSGASMGGSASGSTGAGTSGARSGTGSTSGSTGSATGTYGK